MRATAVLVVLALASGCGTAPAERSGPLQVPQDFPTIQAAVDAAAQGDVVLVSAGTYRESVRVGTSNVVLRGRQRNDVVLDGEVRRANGVVVTAPGVSVENLTVRNHTLNGVLVTGLTEDGGLAHGSDGYERLDPAKYPPLQGFRVSYVTASNNGLYGIYAFDAQHGVIEHSYASGSSDSGFYVGQCKPCDIVVRHNVAERNAVGFEGANASGRMVVAGNRLVGNRVGLTSTSDHQEAFVPQEDATIVGNLVAANNEAASPAQADGGFGIGIGIAGGSRNLVARNRVTGNTGSGVVVASSDDIAPVGNRIEDNVITDNGLDIAYTASARAPGAQNCLERNDTAASTPHCLDGPGSPLTRAAAPPGLPFTRVAAPLAQPEMPTGFVSAPRTDEGFPLPAMDLLAEHAAVRP